MFGMLHDCFDTVLDLWLIYSFSYADWWQRLDNLQASYGLCQPTILRQDMLHSVLFVVVVILISTVTNLPFKIYSTFVIE